MINAYAPGDDGGLSEQERALIARRARVLGPSYRLFYEHPVHVVRGEGVWLYGPGGEAYLDVYNNVAVTGHCHPHVVAAIAGQAALLNTHTRYLNEIIVNFAERLVAKLPDEISQVMFACTGSEANDLALRVARAHTGGTGVIVTETAYHGVTQAIAELSPSLGAGVPLGAHVRTAPAPRAVGDVGRGFADGVRSALADMQRTGVKPAALLVDTVFSSDGVFAEPKGFLAEAVAAARAAGAIFIADEVQAGYGRLGEAFFGFQRHGLVPDLVTMGKPMGAGHPLAAVAGRPEVLEKFGRASRYFNTFGGNPVSCAAGMAVLDVIEAENLIGNALRVGQSMRAAIAALGSAAIVDVRGAGLFIGVELTDADAAARVVNGMRERRVLISATGPRANVLKVRPPLVFGMEHAEIFIDALSAELAHL
ncbi:aspartate aminotransferase family protein [Terricaulis sp.]|uniref:aspartate aminotransferase family protein n=1 Tax=Terricaulis sp. TaxID=2768686 RepID=UPI0037838360